MKTSTFGILIFAWLLAGASGCVSANPAGEKNASRVYESGRVNEPGPVNGPAQADGKIRADWTVTVPSSAFPGDCVPVTVSSALPLEAVETVLRDASGKTVCRAPAFTVPATAGANVKSFRYCVLLPVPIAAKAGNGTLSVTANAESPSGAAGFTGAAASTRVAGPASSALPLFSETPFTVEQRLFTEETIDLDGKNTAIRTDSSPERLEQIRALNALLAARNADAPRFAGPFRAPVDSTRRTSAFGDKRTYRYAGGTTERAVHYGIDFGIPTGTPVFSAGDGVVVMATRRISTGLTVVVEHLPGVYSLYYHLDAILASRGENIRAGTLIGRSGATGLATGPHLHWEFRVNGEAISPDWFLDRILY